MRRKVYFFLFFVIVILSACRIVFLNTTSEEYRIKKIKNNLGEQFVENDFSYNVMGIEILNAEKMELMYKIKDDKVPMDEIYYAIVDVQCTYLGEEKMKPEVTKMYLASVAWNNGVNLYATSQLNGDDFLIAKGGSDTIKIVINLRKDTFSNSGWKDVSARKYQLIMMNYPRAIIVDLWKK